MLLLTQSLGVSDIPDLIVAALWGVAAVLAVMTCFISKNKRAVVGLSLLALAAAMRVVAAVFSSQLNANKLSEITETALGVLTAAAAIVMLTSKNRLSRALWLTASICILLLQTGYLAVLPMSDVLNSAAAQNAAALTLKSLYYASPVFTAALLLALFLNFVLKKNPAKESSTTPVTETGNAAETDTNTEQSEEAQAQTAQSDNAATEADGGEKASDGREESLSAAAPALSPSQPPAPKKRLLYCRHCGFRTESIYSTCPRCSNEMTEILICPNCRTETYGVFCGNCGTKVKK